MDVTRPQPADAHPDPYERGIFDARYLGFLETVTHLRPRLHRYCARMTGSVLDGEDVVQDALFHAYRGLESFDDSRPLAPWLFRIAHNRCLDFIRRGNVRQSAEAAVIVEGSVQPIEPTEPGVSRAIEYLVLALPPKERACVLLKDVFDYSLEEIADLVDSTVGGVKAALSRGRSKLASSRHRPAGERPIPSPESARLLGLYVERFNRRDWDGLRELISADARIGVVDRYAGGMADAPYFARYASQGDSWRMALGDFDGERVVVVFRRRDDVWQASGVVRVDTSESRIRQIVDYSHCSWVIAAAAAAVTVAES